MPTIKGYELQERIGSGGSGVVYRAYQTTVGREVAIKIILPHFASHPEFIRRFELEAQLVARLEHLHIVPLYDFWRDPEGAYLVMRWLRGGSLRTALEQGPYRLETTALLIDQIASALALAHHKGIVHRDLKPANILLDEEGNAYLSDFGIALEMRKSGVSRSHGGMVSGSPDYLSPEQVRGDLITPQADIYSLGVVLYELLTGQHPFPDCTAVERMYRHLNDPLPRIETLPPDLVDGLNAIIQKATAKNPVHRYPDVLTLAAEFRRAAALDHAPESAAKNATTANLVEQLTLREQQILQLIMEGCSNGEIAQQLFVTVGTVKWYIRQIYQKLHVRSRVQAIVRARELKLIVSDSETAAPGSETDSRIQPEPENPYKGLRAFQAADAHDFFGRASLVDTLVRRLKENDRFVRFLAVVGPGGSGKSSVVRAGLIPALWRGEVPGSERWFIIEMVPGAHPLDELEIALTRIAADLVASVREHLERDRRGLVRAASLILPDDGSELVVIIDQLEELFTLVDDDDVRTRFLDLLYCAASDPRSRVRVIVTLRADFYDRPLHYPEFAELVRTRMETVLPLSTSELEDAIVKPAQRVGVSFEPRLVTTMIADTHYQPGALPLLQYALTELFEQREGLMLTHKAYVSLGGAVGALAKRADDLYLEQPPEGREMIRQMFLRLVTLGEDASDTRRRVPRSELLAVTGNPDLMDELIDSYAAYRLLTPDHNPATRSPSVELAHEAILREWLRLRHWMDTSRDDIRQQRRLAAAAADWFRAGQDASYLLRGVRLEQFTDRAAHSQIALTHREREFLEASQGQQTREEKSELARQAHELELTRQAQMSERRAAGRLRYLAAALLVFLAGAVGLSIFAFAQRNDAENARATSAASVLIAQESAGQAQELAVVNGAQAALAQGDLEMALALAVAANRTGHPSGQAQRVLSEAAYRPGPLRHLTGPIAPGMSAAFSPDGRLILTGGLDNTGYVWDAISGKLLHRLEGHTHWIMDVGISPDGSTGFTLSRDRSIVLWNLTTGQTIRRFGSDLIVSPEALSAAFSPDGHFILSNNGGRPNDTPGEAADLILWDVATGEPVQLLHGHTTVAGAVAISPDGHLALSGGLMGEMILWNLDDGSVLQRFSEGSNDWRAIPGDLTFSPDGEMAYALSLNGIMVIWDLNTFQPVKHLGNAYRAENWAWAQFALSFDGRQVCAPLVGEGLGLWDTHTGRLLARLSASDAPVAFSPDGRQLLSASGPELRLWDLSNGAEIQHFETTFPVHPAAGIALSPDATKLLAATGGGMGAARGECDFVVFDVAGGRIAHHFGLSVDEVDALGCVLWATPVFSRDGQTVLTGVDERVIQWDVKTGSRLNTFSGHSASVSSIAVSQDGHTVLSGDLNGWLILWDRATGEEIWHQAAHTGSVSSLVFTTSQAALSSGGTDGSVILWDVLTGEAIRTYQGAQGSIYSLALSPDGQNVLASDESGQLILWDYASGQVVRTIHSPFGRGKAALMPDGRHVLVDGVTLWDLLTGEVIRRYPEGLYVTPSRDGSSFFALSSTRSTSIIQWRVDSLDQLLAWTLANRSVPELSCTDRSLYQLQPACDAAGNFPTRTAYPVAVAVIDATPSPVMDLLGTALPELTLTPSIVPRPLRIAQPGDNRGSVQIGEDQTWLYEGKRGERVTLQVKADHPLHSPDLQQESAASAAAVSDRLDTLVIITAPDGRDLNVYNSGGGMVYDPAQSEDIEIGVNSDSSIEGLVLPQDGRYQIIVSGSGYRTGGSYTLTITSSFSEAISPAVP